MMVFSNHRLGPAAELLVSPEVAVAMLLATAEAARPHADSRWEHELVGWLEQRALVASEVLDVGEIAWSPENFERQRQFVTDSIERAASRSEHARALALWGRMIGAHHREHVVVGRRWPRVPASATA